MPRESREDLLIIKNIDVDCDEITEEVVRKDKTVYDDNGYAQVAFENKIEGFDHSEHFQVKFDGYPHRIEPGKERVMVRYLAEHYAKHLADHVLQKREREILDRTKRVVQLMNNAVERPKVLKQIVVGVYQYYYDSENAADSALDAGTKLGRSMDQVNAGRTAREMGELAEINDTTPMPNKALGVLDNSPAPGSLEAALADVPNDNPVQQEPEGPTAPRDDTKPALDQPDTLTRDALKTAAQDMGIEIKATDTKAQITEKLKQFT